MPRFIVLTLLLAAGLASEAFSQLQVTPATRAQARAIAKVCRIDIQTLCAGVEAGEGRIAACLRDNQAKLSQPCGEALSSLMQK